MLYKRTFRDAIHLFCLLVLASHLGTTRALAQSILPAADGTGTQVQPSAVNPNQFNITGGTQSGANLFHSFQEFGLTSGQIANFLTNPSIQNILGRVTGGNASVINGLIQVSGSHANLYLMNPSGIIFGPNASLNVPASFTATTANAIGVGGFWFNATGTNNYGLLSGIPDSFAFASANPGSILNAGNLAVGTGQSITLLGGTVINTGTLSAPGGTVTIAAVPGRNLVRITQDGLLSLVLPTETQSQINSSNTAPLSLPALLTGSGIPEATGVVVENGVVKLTASNTTIPTAPGTTIVSGQISTASLSPASSTSAIQMLGDRVGLINAHLDASGINGGGTVLIGGDYQGKGTVPNAQNTYVSADSTIKADALTSGNGGKVTVWADQHTQFAGTISARGGAQGGNGGLVETSGKTTLDANGGRVDASASNGQAGTWHLDPTDINIANTGGTITPAAITTALDGGTNVTLTTSSAGSDNGDITLTDSINQTGGGIAALTLTGRRFINPWAATINLTSTGGLTFNLNQVNPETNAPTSSVQSAINSIGTVAGPSTINLGAGTYSGSTLSISKALTLNGAGAGSTILSGNNTHQVLSISNGSGTTVNLNNLTITQGNTTGDGGGIYKNSAGTLNITNSTIANNAAGYYGGGIYNSNGTLNIRTSTISGNSAQSGSGGGIYNYGTTTISTSTLSDNSTQTSGGGIYNDFGSTTTISNSTLSGNSAPQGGGIRNSGGTIAVSNSLITGNTAPNGREISGSITSGGYNLFGYSNNSGLTGATPGATDMVPTVSLNSILTPLGNYGGTTQTMALLPGSPAINAGNPAVTTADQRGVSPVGIRDIGAYESKGFAVVASGGTPQSTTVNTSFTTPLSVAVTETAFNTPLPGATVNLSAPASGASATLSSTTATTNASGQASISASANTVAGSYMVTASATGVSGTASYALTNTPDAPASIATSGGSGQSTVVNTVFGSNLQVTVKDQYGNVVPGATVTFTAPGSGASGTFTSGTTATTNASGIASIPISANTIAGSFTASGSVSSVATLANFNLTNNPDVPASITTTGGSGQSTAVNAAFGTALQAKVTDQYGNPISGSSVTFSVPTTGVSGQFTGNVTTVTATTNASGVAIAPTLTANTSAGSFNGIGSVAGVATNASYSLTSLPDLASATLSANGGSGQSTIVATAFGTNLSAKVVDQYNNPISGINITFAIPGSGASGTGSTTLTTNAFGAVSNPFIANTVAGSYTVTATSANAAGTASYALTNTPDAPASITSSSGSGQSTTAGSAFGTALQAKVTDQYGNPISGSSVTFSVPPTGASGQFTGNVTTVTATTNASGVAIAPTLIANTTPGSFSGTGSVTGVATNANYSLTNLGGSPVTVSIISGDVGSPLQVRVLDSYGNPVSNMGITFTAPNSGAGGSFNGLSTITVVTDSTGIAISPTLISNGIGGNFVVPVSNLGTILTTFNLANPVAPIAQPAILQPTIPQPTISQPVMTQPAILQPVKPPTGIEGLIWRQLHKLPEQRFVEKGKKPVLCVIRSEPVSASDAYPGIPTCKRNPL